MSIRGRVEAGNQTVVSRLDTQPLPALPSQMPANLSITYSDSALCMEGQCGHMSTHVGAVYSLCVHMYRVYVARSGSSQRILVASPLPPLPIPLSGPLPFHVLFLETKVKRKNNRDSHSQGCCLQREGAV